MDDPFTNAHATRSEKLGASLRRYDEAVASGGGSSRDAAILAAADELAMAVRLDLAADPEPEIVDKIANVLLAVATAAALVVLAAPAAKLIIAVWQWALA